ncbi:GPO family capsid scaffolding protein, partial [Hafnia sp.]|uniref:GPO family capsid scaffolding protein n=1 Tax=Hafnia sp. TaxID=1873498 RepID=UPI002FC7D792
MDAAQRVTDWICIATEGYALDGRPIERQMIQDAVELYNPAYYTAMLWPWHPRGSLSEREFTGNLGQVTALKVGQNPQGRLKLFAKILPTQELMNLNARGQKLFSSAEFWPNHAKTGQFYLTGLAVTDIPASLETDQITHPNAKQEGFSARHGALEMFSLGGESLVMAPPPYLPATYFSTEEQTMNWPTISPTRTATAVSHVLHHSAPQVMYTAMPEQPQPIAQPAPQMMYTAAPAQPQPIAQPAPQMMYTTVPAQPQPIAQPAPQMMYTAVPAQPQPVTQPAPQMMYTAVPAQPQPVAQPAPQMMYTAVPAQPQPVAQPAPQMMYTAVPAQPQPV